MNEQELLQQIKELQEENTKLKDLLVYYDGASIIFDKIEETMDQLADAEINLNERALILDQYTEEKEQELSNREKQVSEKETASQRLLAEAQKKSKDINSLIRERVAKETDAYKKTCKSKATKIILGITGLYTAIAIVLYFIR